MRRRHLALALPLGLAVLSACEADPAQPQQASVPARPSDLDPTPVLIGQRAEVVPPGTVNLPLEMTTMIVVDPGWSSTPLVRDGILLAFQESEDRLVFRCADQDGTVLWEAERPRSCTGFALSQDDDGTSIAVLADAEPPGDAHSAMTLTGYELRTATELWGPIGIPGPQVAPGLVFAAPAEGPIGEEGPRIALSARTGEAVLREDALEGTRILAEHGGVILRTDGADLLAVGAGGEEERWRLPLPGEIDPHRARVTQEIRPDADLAVIGDGSAPGTVIDLSDGQVVAEAADAVARDHVMDVTVVAAGAVVRGLDLEGREQWRHEDADQLQFLTAGERLAYSVRREEGPLVVLDTARGIMVDPYDADLDAPLAVPEVFSSGSAAAVSLGRARHLVTSEFDPEFGMR